ncbi:hypothetical protein FisN_33Lh035 [Fistulifera solaris]|uniref:sn-1-specific diacylglycerol lipase n=1 Tax=Fistulifera solaris TaxID=1519565 RepID=A0A1Z5KA54_FISSO|nr:hypothetical protein FisN_33Lh035 [Fistulifera solaris]|eukprot:GAX23143.1 hypothetical protein FisN_33Lh035 [Fistulifera solaris]
MWVTMTMTTLLGAFLLTARPSCNRQFRRTPLFAVGMSTAAVVPNRFRTFPANYRKKNLLLEPLRTYFATGGSIDRVKRDDDTNSTAFTEAETLESQSQLPLDESERENIKKSMKDPTWQNKGKRLQRSIEEGWRRGVADVFSVAGFLSSSLTNLWSDRSQFERLQPTIQAFRDYLKTTEIDMEITKALSLRLLGNILALREIQQYLTVGDRRDEALKQSASKNIPTEEESYRFMKYATAAYGNSMIRSVQIGIDGRFDSRANSMTRTLVSDHVGVPEEDIVSLDLDHDTDGYHLRHFVAVDHINKQVVLAIRGTFSFSEIVVDVAAQSRPFCGGEAHAEMANMAERVWEAARETVMKVLRSNENYELVLTGHSLGAGTACLLHILCHQEERKLVEGRNVRCFAYATPPVFSPLEFVPKSALNSCTGYIYDRDVVPFLSVDSVRHLLASLSAVGNQRPKLWQKFRVLARQSDPDEKLVKLVQEAKTKRLPPKAGAPVLEIPASNVLWIQRTDDSNDFDDDKISYNAKVCDPRKLSKMGIFIDGNMLQDHTPSRYEHALHFLEVRDDVKP